MSHLPLSFTAISVFPLLAPRRPLCSLTSLGRGLGATMATICILSSSMPMLPALDADVSASCPVPDWPEGEASGPLGPVARNYGKARRSRVAIQRKGVQVVLGNQDFSQASYVVG